MEQGKLITIYGTNGIGKTTQVDLLVEYLKTQGKNANRLKYPIYDLEPEGPFINKYLRNESFRKENQLSTEDLQKKYADNRERYQPQLLARLKAGEWIVAEDYTGTGIGWGLTRGANLEYLEGINAHLFKEDLAILMHGERFLTAVEKGHANEEDNSAIRVCKNFHLLLADRYDWEVVNANQPVEQVRRDIAKIVSQLLIGLR